jgi:hypothetical protein
MPPKHGVAMRINGWDMVSPANLCGAVRLPLRSVQRLYRQSWRMRARPITIVTRTRGSVKV